MQGQRDSPHRTGVVNAMSVDVEDYYHAHAVEPWFCRASWPGLERRVESATMRVLDQFERAGVRATFFVLGCVAGEFPGLVREIVARGHELASHGESHRRVDSQSPEEFRADVALAKAKLEDAAGTPVQGYRAPSFSAGPATPWFHAILGETGHTYSSSLSEAHAGVPVLPVAGSRSEVGCSVVELPVTQIRLLGRHIPTGGGYFRLFPAAMFSIAIKRRGILHGTPAVFYYHPWEIDPGQPRSRLGPVTRFRHEVNLGCMERKVDRLLDRFRWAPMREVFAERLEP